MDEMRVAIDDFILTISLAVNLTPLAPGDTNVGFTLVGV
jgi:hypothetical protein